MNGWTNPLAWFAEAAATVFGQTLLLAAAAILTTGAAAQLAAGAPTSLGAYLVYVVVLCAAVAAVAWLLGRAGDAAQGVLVLGAYAMVCTLVGSPWWLAGSSLTLTHVASVGVIVVVASPLLLWMAQRLRGRSHEATLDRVAQRCGACQASIHRAAALGLVRCPDCDEAIPGWKLDRQANLQGVGERRLPPRGPAVSSPA